MRIRGIKIDWYPILRLLVWIAVILAFLAVALWQTREEPPEYYSDRIVAPGKARTEQE